MFDERCVLLRKLITETDAGDTVETDRGLTYVFCEVSSANYKDKDAAKARGLSADLTIRLADRSDYSGQQFVKYNDEEYQVIDRYFNDKSREIRLVVRKWAGQ